MWDNFPTVDDFSRGIEEVYENFLGLFSILDKASQIFCLQRTCNIFSVYSSSGKYLLHRRLLKSSSVYRKKNCKGSVVYRRSLKSTLSIRDIGKVFSMWKTCRWNSFCGGNARSLLSIEDLLDIFNHNKIFICLFSKAGR